MLESAVLSKHLADLGAPMRRSEQKRGRLEPVPDERARMAACLVTLLDRGLFLPGSLEALEHSGTHGITTIRVRHLTFPTGKSIRIQYIGKNFTLWSKVIRADDAVGAALRANLKSYVRGKRPDDLVFTLRAGRPFTHRMLNAYIREITGSPTATCTLFRRYHATRMLRQELRRFRGKSRPRAELEAIIFGRTVGRKYIPGILDRIAADLGHRTRNGHCWRALVTHSVDPAMWREYSDLGIDFSHVAALAR